MVALTSLGVLSRTWTEPALGATSLSPRHCPLGVADLEPCAPPAVAAACSRSGGGMLKWRWVILAWSVWVSL